MGIAHRSARLFRGVTIAGLALAGPITLGLGNAHAGEVVLEPEIFNGASADAAPSTLRTDDIELGLDALALLKRHRSEQRRVPRMLPLAAARTQHGQLWLGLARARGGAQPYGNVRVELWWTIPIGH